MLTAVLLAPVAFLVVDSGSAREPGVLALRYEERHLISYLKPGICRIVRTGQEERTTVAVAPLLLMGNRRREACTVTTRTRSCVTSMPHR